MATSNYHRHNGGITPLLSTLIWNLAFEMLSWDLWGVWLATPGWNLFLYLFFLFPFSLSSISFKYVVFFYWRDRYRDICKQRCLGTSWMGWGPIDLVGRVLPEAKFREKMHLFLFFGFERLIPRYLLKTVLNPIIWLRAGRTWAVGRVCRNAQPVLN